MGIVTTVLLLTNALLSGQNSLQSCALDADGNFTNCHTVTDAVNLQMVNPNRLAFSDAQELFISNFGVPYTLGTSYMNRCSFADGNVQQCYPFLALASPFHLTGLNVQKDKLFFVESYPYGGKNYNYLVTCNIPEPINTMLNVCGPSVYLNNHQAKDAGYNLTTDIAIDASGISIADPVGNAFFKCSLPDQGNNVTCTKTSETAPVLVDAAGNYLCSVNNTGGVNCCTQDTKQCTTITPPQPSKPITIAIDAPNAALYFVNAPGVPVQETFGRCSLSNQEPVVSNCNYFTPEYSDTSKEITGVSKILFVQSNL